MLFLPTMLSEISHPLRHFFADTNALLALSTPAAPEISQGAILGRLRGEAQGRKEDGYHPIWRGCLPSFLPQGGLHSPLNILTPSTEQQ